MRLYQTHPSDPLRQPADYPRVSKRPIFFVLVASFIALGLLSACQTKAVSPAGVKIEILADGDTKVVEVPPGTSVQQALDQAGIILGDLDRVDPPMHIALQKAGTIRVVRVREEYEVVQEVIPFQHQTVRNESLPLESEMYLQRGENGLQEITYRRVYDDGELVSEGTIVKRTIVKEPVPEIVMIGIQSPFYPVSVPGKLIYIRDGNAWIIEENTANRRALITTGDLDGRVLSLSPDGNWLLFSRKGADENEINGLWVLNLADQEAKLLDLKVPNVVHFADWLPGSNSQVIFSTVEPRPAAPGWQANNDLRSLRFSPNGWTTDWTGEPLVDANTGGVYGWWGTSFAWSPDGEKLAFTRPDTVGIVNLDDGSLEPKLGITPLQTRGDWAWVPGITWSPDGKMLFTVEHVAPPGAPSPEESPDFAITALTSEDAQAVQLVSPAGMFAYPLASPLQKDASGETGYQVAFLQAIFPTQSDTSRYRLAVMDSDGSNRKMLYPPESQAGGLEPSGSWGAWSPGPLPDNDHYSLAIIDQGNLWLVDSQTGEAQQVTGDGLTTRVIWK